MSVWAWWWAVCVSSVTRGSAHPCSNIQMWGNNIQYNKYIKNKKGKVRENPGSVVRQGGKFKCPSSPRYQHVYFKGPHGRCPGDTWCCSWPSCLSQHPSNIELVLRLSAMELPEAHIYHFAPAKNNSFIGNPRCSGVVHLYRAVRLGPTLVNECLVMGDHFSCGDKVGCKFWFSSQCHDKLDDLGNRQNCTIQAWEWVIFQEEDVSISASICASTQDHVASPINNAIIGIGSNVIK